MGISPGNTPSCEEQGAVRQGRSGAGGSGQAAGAQAKAGPTLPLTMVSMVMSVYSSATGSALPEALPQPSTTALPPAGGAQGVLATGVASGDPRNARKGGTFANVFSEIKQSLQDGISLLGDLHVLINLRRKTIVAMSECSQIGDTPAPMGVGSQTRL